MDKLIIVDMQNDFIDGALGNPLTKEIIPDMCELIKHFKGDIYFTQDTHYTNSYNLTVEGQTIPEHCLANTEGVKIPSKLLKAAHNKKAHFISKSSFAPDMNFREYFNVKLGDVFYVCGTCTDICVISTVLKLRSEFPSIKIVVYDNLCTGTTMPKHLFALKVMESCLIEIKEYQVPEVEEEEKEEKTETISYGTVQVNSHGTNAKFKFNILPEETMRAIGFTDYNEKIWYYFKYLDNDISFDVSIPKDGSEAWIDILDEELCQPYDYQYMLEKNAKNEFAKAISEKVNGYMVELSDLGVIENFEVGDYI